MEAEIREQLSHKGEYCPYKKILLCQEGVCYRCQIFIDWYLNLFCLK